MTNILKVVFTVITVAIMGCVTFLAFSFYQLQSNVNSKIDELGEKVDVIGKKLVDVSVGFDPYSVQGDLKLSEGGIDGSKISFKVPAPSTQIADCGTDPSCIDAKFVKCEPAGLDVSISGGKQEGHFQILGLESGKCSVRFNVTHSEKIEENGTSMVCLYDNSQPLLKAHIDMVKAWATDINAGNCTGDFYEYSVSKYK